MKSTQNCCLNFFNFLIFYQKTSAGGLHQQSSQSDRNPLSTSPFNMFDTRRMYLTSELSPSLSTPGWTTAVKSSSKIWTTFEWYTLNLRSTSTQTYLYVVMISQRYGRIGCTSCFMCGADLITLITHLPHVACHIDTNPALNHGAITNAISKWCHGDIKTCKAAIPPSSPVPVP